MLSRLGLVTIFLLAGTPLPRLTDPFTGMAFVRIPAGTFTMGTPLFEPKREAQETQHQVTLARDFYLAIHEVTQREWRRVTGDNPSSFSGCDSCPVERVTYHDVEKFLMKLNGASSWPGFRLPTEAEWEYACRAGGTKAYGDRASIDRTRANYDGTRTKPVGSFAPNAWGLFDMSGNVWEWTSDDHSPGLKVIRGGSWRFGADSARCGLRYTHRPQDRGYSLGLRLAHE
jgi:formylglycine-generating enzyme required for sulfatase activity